MALKSSFSFWVLTSLFSSTLIITSTSYKFYVGGKDGWVLKPSENYNQWAGRMRFQVNDTIFFKYKNGEDSVLVVNKLGEYENCNKQNPIQKFDAGDSIFMFDRSGPFYFISGHFDNCEKGQKLIVVVMAVRNKYPKPAPFPTASPPTALAPAINVPEIAPVHAPAAPATPGSIITPSQASLPSPVDNSTSTPPSPPRSAATGVRPSVVLVLFLMGAVKFGLF